MELPGAWEPPVNLSVARTCATLEAQNCLIDGDKMKKHQMEKEKFKIGLLNGLMVPSVGRSGGLAMLWSRDIKVEI